MTSRIAERQDRAAKPEVDSATKTNFKQDEAIDLLLLAWKEVLAQRKTTDEQEDSRVETGRA